MRASELIGAEPLGEADVVIDQGLAGEGVPGMAGMVAVGTMPGVAAAGLDMAGVVDLGVAGVAGQEMLGQGGLGKAGVLGLGMVGMVGLGMAGVERGIFDQPRDQPEGKIDLGMVRVGKAVVGAGVVDALLHWHPPAMEPVVNVVAKSLSRVRRTSRAYAR